MRLPQRSAIFQIQGGTGAIETSGGTAVLNPDGKTITWDLSGTVPYTTYTMTIALDLKQDGNGVYFTGTLPTNAGDASLSDEEDKTVNQVAAPELRREPVTLTPVDITGYTGGESMSDDTFPTVRYQIDVLDGIQVEDLTFYYEGAEEAGGKAIAAGSYYVIPALDNTFTPLETSGSSQSPASHDGIAGIYSIGVENAGAIRATDGSSTVYPNVPVLGEAELTVRYVYEPTAVLDDHTSVTTHVVQAQEDVDTSQGLAVAVIEDAGAFYTNGKSRSLGLVGTQPGEGADGAQIALLFDEILDLQAAVGREEDAIQRLIQRANAELPAVTFTPGQYEFKYMDLVNTQDGNAWVSSSKDITIFWPYPDEIKDSYSQYTYQVLHFQNLHREAYAGTSNGVLDQISQSPVTEISGVTATEKGVRFTLTGDAELGSFSPFALLWTKSGGNLPPAGTGSLAVSKTVSGNQADSAKDFHFTVKLSDTGIQGAYGGMTFADGVAVFTLRHGQTVTATGLPAGTTYQITETEANQDGYTTTAVRDSGTIPEGGTAAAAFTNTKQGGGGGGPEPSRPTGSLTISKTVTGKGDTDKDFTFTITITSSTGSPLGNRFSFSGSKSGTIGSGGSITLRDGQSVTIQGIPAGSKYTVTEAEANQNGYTTTSEGGNRDHPQWKRRPGGLLQPGLPGG